MLVIVLFVLILVSIWMYLRNRNQVFKRIDVPGPEPMLLFGNLLDIKNLSGFHKSSAKIAAESFHEWTKEYGKVYGIYEGGSPILVTSDPDIIQEVFIKQFSNFHGRKLFDVQENPETGNEIMMFYARGLRWKRLRNISNPTFTSMKIKQMFPILVDCVDEFLHVIQKRQETGRPIDIHKLYQGMSMDAIARTCFGYASSVQSNPNELLLQVCRNMLGTDRKIIQRLIILISLIMPEVKFFFGWLHYKMAYILKLPYVHVTERLKRVVEERKKMKSEKFAVKDFIQLLIEAETTDEDFQINSSSKIESMQNLSVERKLTSNEIVTQCFLFLAAGFETTSATLGFASYEIAAHPEVEEKLYQELIDVTSNGENITYDALQKATYMEMVLNETLRLYPVGQVSSHRRCSNSCTVNGVRIPEGVSVWVDVLTLHRSEEYWGPDAKEFNPERFSPEQNQSRHPMVYIPFGAGPRNCIGMRFAMIEAKLVLAKVMLVYKMKLVDKSAMKLVGNPVGLSPEKVMVYLEKRKT